MFFVVFILLLGVGVYVLNCCHCFTWVLQLGVGVIALCGCYCFTLWCNYFVVAVLLCIGVVALHVSVATTC
jgi:hypothetical protein